MRENTFKIGFGNAYSLETISIDWKFGIQSRAHAINTHIDEGKTDVFFCVPLNLLGMHRNSIE